MPNEPYPLFAWAIENHIPLRCRYKGMPREFCPITLGHDDKGAVAHVWVTGGAASGPLAAPPVSHTCATSPLSSWPSVIGQNARGMPL